MLGAPKVLLVEDESITRASIADILKREGYNVKVASNGIEALDRLAEGHFDLVVTDLVMPRMDGFKLIAKVHSMSPGTGIVLITAYLSKASGDAILARMAELIVKPIEADDLLAAVKRIVDRADH